MSEHLSGLGKCDCLFCHCVVLGRNNNAILVAFQAMARMREYERKLTEGLAAASDEASPLFKRSSAATNTDMADATSSSAHDRGNESSESEAQVRSTKMCLRCIDYFFKINFFPSFAVKFYFAWENFR